MHIRQIVAATLFILTASVGVSHIGGHTLWIAPTVVALIFLLLLAEQLPRKRPIMWRNIALLSSVVGILGIGIVGSVIAGASRLLTYISSLPHTSQGAALAVATCASAGVALFFVRLRLRVLYGLSEVAIGCALAASKSIGQVELKTPAIDAEFVLVLLTAAVYLIVRGLDNVHQGLTKEPLDWLVVKLRRGGVRHN